MPGGIGGRPLSSSVPGAGGSPSSSSSISISTSIISVSLSGRGGGVGGESGGNGGGGELLNSGGGGLLGRGGWDEVQNEVVLGADDDPAPLAFSPLSSSVGKSHCEAPVRSFI